MASGIEIPEITKGNGSKFSLLDVPLNLGPPQTQPDNESQNVTLFQVSPAQRLFELARKSVIQKDVMGEFSLPTEMDQSVEDLGIFELPPAHDPNESKFRELTRQWQDETATSSSVTEMAMHPAYQQIIGMGRDALPFIFRELEKAPHHWFWALRAITGENPVKPEHRGNLDAMTKDWLEWAEE